jgi:hypothetical protein
MTLDTTIERDEIEISITVDYSHSRARRGRRDSLCGVPGAGAPLEPDEPEDIEILSVTGPDGKEMDLSDAELERIEQQCWDALDD